VLKAFAMLRAFRAPNEHLTSAELSRRAGLPEASGYRLIQTLEVVGAVVRDARGRYRPGFVLTGAPGQNALGEALKAAAQPVLDELADRFGATAHLGVLEHGMVTYVAKAVAPASVTVPTQVGAQQEAYCSAIGKVLLAALSDEALDTFLEDGELVALTDRTITDRVVFRREIRRVQETGYALDTGEAHAHLCCVAAAVRDESGRTLAALSIVDRIESMTQARREHMRLALVAAASSVTGRLGSGSSLHLRPNRAGHPGKWLATIATSVAGKLFVPAAMAASTLT
jgi:DNA-binding IclR family transcriptional regulator